MQIAAEAMMCQLLLHSASPRFSGFFGRSLVSGPGSVSPNSKRLVPADSSGFRVTAADALVAVLGGVAAAAARLERGGDRKIGASGLLECFAGWVFVKRHSGVNPARQQTKSILRAPCGNWCRNQAYGYRG